MSDPSFPPPPTPAEMSTLLHGLGALYAQVTTINEHLAALEASLDALAGKVGGGAGAPHTGGPVATPAAENPYYKDLEAFMAQQKAREAAAAGPNPGSPQINGGIDTIKLPNGNSTGRIYCDDQSSTVKERFVVEAATPVREAAHVRYVDLAVNPTYDNDRLAPAADLGTGYTHANQPASVYALDDYVVTSVPTSGTGAPPAGVVRRYYHVKVIDNGTESGEVGRVYREFFINSNDNEQWVDHWVLFPGYKAPKAADNIEVKVVNDSGNAPQSAQAFFDAVNDYITDNPGTYKYIHLVLEWKVFGV